MKISRTTVKLQKTLSIIQLHSLHPREIVNPKYYVVPNRYQPQFQDKELCHESHDYIFQSSYLIFQHTYQHLTCKEIVFITFENEECPLTEDRIFFTLQQPMETNPTQSNSKISNWVWNLNMKDHPSAKLIASIKII